MGLAMLRQCALHFAGDTLAVVCDMIGSHIDAGPYAEPNERPYIERFFGTVGSTLSHRLPGTTGTCAQDVRRALSDPDGNASLLVSSDELTELLDVTFANYNGTRMMARRQITNRGDEAFHAERWFYATNATGTVSAQSHPAPACPYCRHPRKSSAWRAPVYQPVRRAVLQYRVGRGDASDRRTLTRLY